MTPLPDLPGDPINQARALADWGMLQEEIEVFEAAADLRDALDSQGAWYTTGYSCEEWSGEWSAVSQGFFDTLCDEWAGRVLVALGGLFEAVELYSPAVAEAIEANGAGVAAQAAEASAIVGEALQGARRSSNLVAAGLLAVGLWFLFGGR